MNKPIIFLNIDGVLISENYIRNNSGNILNLYRIIDNKYYMNFEPDKIDLLKKLVDEVDSYIVISSYWCETNDLNTIKKIFSKYELDDKIIDLVKFDVKKNGYRIQNWINNQDSKIDNYIIIDDANIGILDDKQIKCNPSVGLSKNDVEKSIKLLKK